MAEGDSKNKGKGGVIVVGDIPTLELDDDENTKIEPAPLSKVFAEADWLDLVLILFGSINAIGGGLAQPAMMVIFGDMLDSFNGVNLLEEVESVALSFVWLGIFSGVTNGLSHFCFATAGLRQTKRWRSAFLTAILRQDVGWFDVANPSTLTSKIAEATQRVESGIGVKMSEGIMFMSGMIGGFVLGFYYEAAFTAILIATTPLIGVCGWYLQKVTLLGEKVDDAYGKAGAVCSQALGSLRTVYAHNGQAREIKKYDSHLDEAMNWAINIGWKSGAGIGAFFGSFNAFLCVATVYGAYLLANDLENGRCNDVIEGEEITSTAFCSPTAGRLFTVMMCVQMGGMSLGQLGPAADAFGKARRAMGAMLKIIERVPTIDVYSDAGTKPATVAGSIDVENVDFSYPSRPDIQVCKKYSLKIPAGSTVALVGASGSGKSTLVNLVERFYDPQGGCIKLDGTPLKDLNIKWLRQQIGYVGQEPRLFAGNIRDNIANGMVSFEGVEVSQEMIETAAKKANAHDFITELPQGYDTLVGEGGVAMSGGQKQRIAIARALLKQPKILILDEATSALDNKSEKVVQQALDLLMQEHSMTMIVIAHRLSTIRFADKIAVVHQGTIVEEGKHDELMAIKDGHYQKLYQKLAPEDPAASGGPSNKNTPMGSTNDLAGLLASKSKMQNPKAVEAKDKDEVKDKEKEKAEKKEHDAVIKKLTSRVWKMQRADSLGMMLVGVVGAAISGLCFPLGGIMWTEMLDLLYDNDYKEMRRTSYIFGGIWIGLGLLQTWATWLQYGGFISSAQNLVRKLRLQAFQSLMTQDIGWYDKEENNSGAISARLAKDVQLISDATGGNLSRMAMNLFSLGLGICVALFYCWQLALISIATVPLNAIGAMFQLQQVSGTSGTRSDTSKAGQVVSEAVMGIRTVATLGMEGRLVKMYRDSLMETWSTDNKNHAVGSIGRGYAEFIMLAIDALLFYCGALFVDDGIISFKDMIMVIFILLMSSFGLAQAMSTMGDKVKTEDAMKAVFEVIDRVPEIDNMSEEGQKPPTCKGEIAFQGVHFRYPTRPEAAVCQGYTFTVPAGTTVALCGASGSGKSTAIQLLERFYDPTEGDISLDGVPLKALNIQWLRKQVGLVRQEPVLFTGTVRDNILYGNEAATTADVEWAAQMANAHDFIMQLPEGYDTEVGDQGSRLSGGQKQRVAIARALVSRPKVLLLDEATSALDSESEKLVQSAIDKITSTSSMTTLVIAHRLSTIRNANLICVIDQGRIIEQGNHTELMAIPNGAYEALVRINESQI